MQLTKTIVRVGTPVQIAVVASAVAVAAAIAIITAPITSNFVVAPAPFVTCTDTDGGQNFAVKGTTHSGAVTMADYCQNKATLIELYCNPVRKYAAAVGHICANGCAEGVCNQASTTRASLPPVVTCSDTDGGINYEVKGTVESGITMADHCKNATTLNELYCDPVRQFANASEKVCANGCGDGVCKLATTTTTVTATVGISTSTAKYHDADTNHDYSISKDELAYATTLFDSVEGYSCNNDYATKYIPGKLTRSCGYYSGDINKDWILGLNELLRIIQLSNFPSYQSAVGTVDGFAPVVK